MRSLTTCRGTPPTPSRRQPLALLLALIAPLCACGLAEEQPFGEFVSPGGDWTLRIAVAESNYPQGPWHVLAYLNQRGAEQAITPIIDTTLANDGIPFSSDNVAIRWISSKQALMCLRATDLPDRGLRIEVGAPPRIVEVERC